MAREIKTHDLDTDSSDGPEPPVPEYPVVGLQQERNDLEVHMEEDGDNSYKDLTEQNEEEREADITAESNADEQEDTSNESEAAEEQEQRGSGDSESAEEEEEADEYDELRQWAIESNVAHKNLDKLTGEVKELLKQTSYDLRHLQLGLRSLETHARSDSSTRFEDPSERRGEVNCLTLGSGGSTNGQSVRRECKDSAAVAQLEHSRLAVVFVASLVLEAPPAAHMVPCSPFAIRIQPIPLP
ncbi:ribosomal biogenesis protein LAS1L-like [Neodiprion fabricii]|uniref:ribosomal biogenesis protein LAS1L-like n=1 Tax=Neodiprion fabricii TaxID=2872261 RepID=UPI001ED94D7F|nr:ribosomal biogenesis protein LAS1L-like [Neodiprion fabricii]